MIYLIGLGVLGILFLSSNVSISGVTDVNSRLFKLKDVDPYLQGGKYKKDFDLLFENEADATGVPFALLKAHAIAESSLNPTAFTDENPSKRADRLGWASRGLMQLLFWPGSNRFEQFGYSSSDLSDGEKLLEPGLNIKIGARLIKANLIACSGNLRDAINMYNTGVKEKTRQAPNGYVDRVLNYYNIMTGV